MNDKDINVDTHNNNNNNNDKKNNKNIRYNKLNCWNTRKYKGKIL